jgi:ketosteroid isomerase-like protein
MTETGFATPDEAETAFYDAFRASNLEAMMNIWADQEFIECIHPMSDRDRGTFAVRESWRRIFDGGLKVELELSDIHRTQDALLAIHTVYEHFRTPGDDRQHPPVIATNIYQLIDGGWHMVLHHASPSPQDELSTTEQLPEQKGQPRLH